jgi:hypothetical protein
MTLLILACWASGALAPNLPAQTLKDEVAPDSWQAPRRWTPAASPSGSSNYAAPPAASPAGDDWDAWASGLSAGDGNGPCCPDYCECWADGGLCPSGRLELRGDYLLWWGKGEHVPPLVTTSPVGTPRDQAGVMGLNTTTVLFGNGDVNGEARSGERVTLDYWLGADQSTAIEGDFVGLGDHRAKFAASSQGNPILARPFYNVSNTSTGPDSSLVAFTTATTASALLTGSVDMSDRTSFCTAELLLRRNLVCQYGNRIDLLLGYRYARLADDLQMSEFQKSEDPNGRLPEGTTLSLFDHFQTRNEFHGAQVGMLTAWRRCAWSGEFLLKLGVGNTRSLVAIDGSTVITEPNQAPATYQGGLLALPTNIGQSDHNQFTMIPELGMTIGYDLTCRLRATVGYSLIYWSKVARPGDQIDTNLNQTQFPPNTLVGVAQPQVHYTTTDFWAQGLNLGLDLRF